MAALRFVYEKISENKIQKKGLDGCPNNNLNRPPYIPTSLREGRDPETVSLFEK